MLTNDTDGVVLVRHRFPRFGQQDYQSAHVYRLEGGRFMECWEQPRDPIAFDAAWA